MGAWEGGRSMGGWEGGSMGGWEHGRVGAWVGGSMGVGLGWEHGGGAACGCMGVELHVGGIWVGV